MTHLYTGIGDRMFEVVATVELEGSYTDETQEVFGDDYNLLVYDTYNVDRPYWRLPPGTYYIVKAI